MLRPLGGALPALLIAGALGAAPGAGLEGRWLLVEGGRGEGGAVLPGDSAPLQLEFIRQGTRLTGRVLAPAAPPGGWPWPALIDGGRPRAISLERLDIDAAGDRARAIYVARDPTGSGEDLRIEEEYAVGEGGRSLSGTVKVTLLAGGEPAGGYLLRRRFVRAP